ncbi:MAG: SLBB domain-containing protein [Clostridiales bacterium]|jgi:Na+-translocating ferredoxin:NAD+ oxidoreductase RnfC subunit|nr:SLBB domain-containing protein [Clostridiales bacterium]
MDAAKFADTLRAAGVVGCGGAGFPSYAKLVPGAKSIILNCAECEPLLTPHRQLLAMEAPEIIGALARIAEIIGAPNVVVAVKETFRGAIAAVREEIAGRPAFRLMELPDVYPMGDEVILVYEATGIALAPGELPSARGIAVINPETALNASRAMRHGAGVTDKLVTIAGAVQRPATALLPLGVSFAEAVDACGGATTPDPAYISGGAMMGFAAAGSSPVVKTTNAIIVLPSDHKLILRRETPARTALKRAAAACCSCSACADFCPRALLGHPIRPDAFARAAFLSDTSDLSVFAGAEFCSGCGVCEMFACPQGLSPRAIIMEYKSRMRAAGAAADAVPGRGVSPERGLRRVSEERLTARIGLSEYSGDSPVTALEIKPRRVRLPLRQHIGAPSVPTVRPGADVTRGQRIAAPGPGLSVALHASVAGRISDVTDNHIVIEG